MYRVGTLCQVGDLFSVWLVLVDMLLFWINLTNLLQCVWMGMQFAAVWHRNEAKGSILFCINPFASFACPLNKVIFDPRLHCNNSVIQLIPAQFSTISQFWRSQISTFSWKRALSQLTVKTLTILSRQCNPIETLDIQSKINGKDNPYRVDFNAKWFTASNRNLKLDFSAQSAQSLPRHYLDFKCF